MLCIFNNNHNKVNHVKIKYSFIAKYIRFAFVEKLQIVSCSGNLPLELLSLQTICISFKIDPKLAQLLKDSTVLN